MLPLRIAAVTTVCLVAASSTRSEVVFPRSPALSPDGKTLVFSYQGDLWSAPVAGGQDARRLTVHPAYDSRPVFSPDGTKLLFASNRNGRDDVFVMPAGGGEPKRLTFYSGGSAVLGWADSGRRALFAQRRELQRRGPAFYTVAAGAEPGRPRPVLAISNLLTGELSPDGTKLVFAQGSSDWARRGYRGSASADIWVFDLARKTFAQLTDFDGQDLWPHWLPDSKTVVYASERDGTYNLWKVSASGGKATQLTKYQGDGVRFPSVSGDGSQAVFEQGDGISTVALSGAAPPRRVPLALGADQTTNPVETATLTGQASEAVPSPDGDQLALVLRGDVFVAGRDTGRATRLTDAPERDADIAWSPDGKRLVFVSRRDGDPELYQVTSADTDEPRLTRALHRTTTRLTTTRESESSPVFSPEGTKLAFRRGRGQLVVSDADGKSAKVVFSALGVGEPVWSPDGRYLALSRDDELFNSEVVIVAADGSGEPLNVSRHPRNDRSPAWSPDGTKLFFASERNGREFDLFYVYLNKQDDDRTASDWAFQRESRAKAGAKAPVRVTIDGDGIWERVRRLTTASGDETGPVTAAGADGKTLIAYSASGDVSLIEFTDGGPIAPRRLAPAGRQLAFTKDGKSLFFVGAGGTVAAVATVGAGDARPFPYRARLTIDRPALQRAVFDEAWRALDEGFYDPTFHGADWATLHEKYAPLAAAASSNADFFDVIRLMMGHLNASHIGATPASGDQPEPVPTGALGVIWDDTFTGKGLKIARVLKGGPADRSESRLFAGESVTAINGVALRDESDPDILLTDTVDERTELRVTASDGTDRIVIIRPTAPARLAELLYEDWIAGLRERTHALSGGKLAYLHIRSMDRVSQDRFEAGLYAEGYGRDALLIDVRDNGGGSTADYLLTMLSIPQHAYTIGRDGAPGYPQDRLPLIGWSKPAGLLINQNSYSNAEIFAHAFRNTGRGPILGTETFGAVISTGAASLLDGSSIRMPGRGWYDLKTGENEEHRGAKPDQAVALTPADEWAGHDPQLEAAVKRLLGGLKPVVLPAPKPAR
jgi:tricorn protease